MNDSTASDSTKLWTRKRQVNIIAKGSFEWVFENGNLPLLMRKNTAVKFCCTNLIDWVISSKYCRSYDDDDRHVIFSLDCKKEIPCSSNREMNPLVVFFSVALHNENGEKIWEKEFRKAFDVEKRSSGNCPPKIFCRPTTIETDKFPIASGAGSFHFGLQWGFQEYEEFPEEVEFIPSIADNLNEYALSDKYSDVVFRVGEEDFPAHKIVLAAQSDVFAATFSHGMKEQRTNIVVIEDIEPDVFREVLRFVYSDTVSEEVLNKYGASLLMAADKYHIPKLLHYCLSHAVTEKLEYGEAVRLYLLANLHRKESLKKKILRFLKDHSKEFITSDDWKKLHKNDPALAAEILSKTIAL